jgi:hypothetical protein
MKLIATIVGFAALAVLALVGVNVWLYLEAFGSAKCTGMNVFAVIPLVIEAVVILIALVQSIDMLSDMAAASNSRKAAVDANKDFAQAFKAQQAQFGALNAAARAGNAVQPKGGQGQEGGGLGFDEGLFSPNIPGEE